MSCINNNNTHDYLICDSDGCYESNNTWSNLNDNLNDDVRLTKNV